MRSSSHRYTRGEPSTVPVTVLEAAEPKRMSTRFGAVEVHCEPSKRKTWGLSPMNGTNSPDPDGTSGCAPETVYSRSPSGANADFRLRSMNGTVSAQPSPNGLLPCPVL